MNKYTTKNSGKNKISKKGVSRDSSTGKSRLAYWMSDDIPYKEQFLVRMGFLAQRGAEVHGKKNCNLAGSQEDLDRFKEGAFTHFMQWYCGEDDEDHASALAFNVWKAEDTKYRLENE